MFLFLPQISIFDYNSFASDKNKGTRLKGLIVERSISVLPVYLHNGFFSFFNSYWEIPRALVGEFYQQ